MRKPDLEITGKLARYRLHCRAVEVNSIPHAIEVSLGYVGGWVAYLRCRRLNILDWTISSAFLLSRLIGANHLRERPGLSSIRGFGGTYKLLAIQQRHNCLFKKKAGHLMYYLPLRLGIDLEAPHIQVTVTYNLPGIHAPWGFPTVFEF